LKMMVLITANNPIIEINQMFECPVVKLENRPLQSLPRLGYAAFRFSMTCRKSVASAP
jgi:hypothetical protein